MPTSTIFFPTLAILPWLFINGWLAAAGIATVSIPIAIHLLTRMRRQQQPWAAMRFLIEAYRRQRQRLRLEQLLLLLVRCLILLILGLALAGPFLGGLARGLGADGGGRLVCIVLDDALSTQAAGADHVVRFENLRRSAGKILDHLRPGDRVAIWTAARPLATPLLSPTPDLAQVRLILDGLRPRSSRSDWPAALAAVKTLLAEQNLDRQRAWVVLLSDFAAGTLEVDRPAPAALAGIGKQAVLTVARPSPQAGNFQVAALTPSRGMILADAVGPATIPLELRLRRFGSEATATSSAIKIELFGEDPAKPIAAISQDFHWAAGQASAALNLDIPVPASAAASVSGASSTTKPAGRTTTGPGAVASGGAGQILAVRATIEPAGDDALASDNRRVALVELRRKLHVGILDDAAAAASSVGTSGAGAVGTGVSGSGGVSTLRPHDWLAIALSPQTPRRGTEGADASRPIELLDVPPAAVNAESLARLDVVMLLRPDLVAAPGWTALRDFTRRGGLLWVFAPNVDTPALWANTFREQLGLDWQIGLAPHDAPASAPAPAPGNGSASSTPSASPAKAPASNAWSLDVDAPAPEPLRLLSADWGAVLRYVSVSRRIDLAPRTGQESVWLRVAHEKPDAPSALLASAPVGEGRVIFLAVALDTAWTNLMTKPLFLPLLHETVRGVLGSSAEALRRNAAVSGDQPSLSPRWEGTQDLRRIDGTPSRVAVRRTDAGLELAGALQDPGIYAATPTASLRLAVNPDADAGNTAALDPVALGSWLTGLGDWSWLDEEAPDKALLAEPLRTNLGWPLLWVTLALLLLETWLARRFSHAAAGGRLAPAGQSDPDAPSAAVDAGASVDAEVTA
ncbi:MAG: VWA domain-containing protein [Planctomycetota bacterium]|nr:VWA domain-containing protein [Planctomycetota bacterium]